MSRPRAGHGWTSFFRNGRLIKLIADDDGRLITTGEAKGWPRCKRCRRPTRESPFNSNLCPTCYFYKTGLSHSDFWRLHEEGYYLAPYNIGRRVTMGCLLDRKPLENDAVNWREYLKTQPGFFG